MENSFNNYRIIPNYSEIISRKECDTSYYFRYHLTEPLLRWNLPLIPANMDTITGPKMEKFCSDINIMPINTRYFDFFEDDVLYPYYKFISVGSIYNDQKRIDKAIYLSNKICIDIAHGHSLHMKDTISYIKKNHNKKFKAMVIIAGNVVTSKAVLDLHSWGADIVKVGIGQGFVCETTTKTGVGLPQMHALLDCGQSNKDIPIIADGGIRHPADFCKAMAIPNVIAVMAGSIFAGTDMTPTWQGEGKPCIYRGMASKEARQSVGISDYIEGRSVDIMGKPIGSTEAIFNEYKHALQSAMSYVGAKNLAEYKQKATLQCIKD